MYEPVNNKLSTENRFAADVEPITSLTLFWTASGDINRQDQNTRTSLRENETNPRDAETRGHGLRSKRHVRTIRALAGAFAYCPWRLLHKYNEQ